MFILVAVACVHGTAWMTWSSTREILWFGPKLITRLRSCTALVSLLQAAVAVARMRRQWQVAAIHDIHQLTTRQQRHEQSVCQWSTCMIQCRRMLVLQQCVTVNRHCQLVCYVCYCSALTIFLCLVKFCSIMELLNKNVSFSYTVLMHICV